MGVHYQRWRFKQFILLAVVASASRNEPPSIASQPANQAGVLGNSATFTVGVTGTAPFGYQWKFNSTPISAAVNPTATNAMLVLTNVQVVNAGNYSVTVTNFYGSTNSSNALLTILFPPTITPAASQPTGATGLHRHLQFRGCRAAAP